MQVQTFCRSAYGRTCEFTVDWFPHSAQMSLMRILIPAELAGRGSTWEPEAQLSDLVVHVSNDTSYWEQVADGSSAAPFATGWTELNIDSPKKSRYVRVQITKSGYNCIISEVEFIGVTQPLAAPASCNVTITVFSRSGNVTVQQADAYSYDMSSTPVVTSVNPPYGTAAGGTFVEVLGRNLPASLKDAMVEIDGVPCAVMSTSPTNLTCVTGERPGIPDVTSFSVSSLSFGTAVLGSSTFAYKDLWSSRITWAGACPARYKPRVRGLKRPADIGTGLRYSRAISSAFLT